MLSRILLCAAALLLSVAAGLQLVDGTAVAGWLPDERGAVMLILWSLPGLDWIIAGLALLFIALRNDRRLLPLALLIALIPAAAAIAIAALLGTLYLGAWLLAGAALLAVLGGISLPRR